jgi:hypothetical protein
VLFILLAALVAVFGAALWIVSVLLQGWLYNDLAKKLPLRALAGGALLALFHTGWCAVYRADPGRFDTPFYYKSEAREGQYDQFQSIRKVGQKELPPVKYVRRGESNDFESETGKHWKRSDADGMVVAILIQEKDKKEPTRFNANLTSDGKFRSEEESRYETDGGKRFMELQGGMGKVYRKRSWGVIANLFANFLHLLVWVAILWPIMRFTLSHAIGFGLILWALTMLLLQPALFSLVTRPM